MMNLSVRDISQSRGREYIKTHHYTGGCAVGSMMWGLFEGEDLVGAIAFHTPISENVRRAVFDVDGDCWCDEIGESHGFHQHVTELHRLVTNDELPDTATSWFISEALDRLKDYKPKYWAVLSFADGAEGHVGTVYQASNAIYTGQTGGSRKFYRDQDGVLRPPRNGIEGNISPAEARERGWEVEERPQKFRYLFLLPDGQRHRRWLENHLAYESREYPSVESTAA